MHNFQINFSYPWFLLLLIPALVMSLWPHLKLSKRYRRTRSRISSLVLHIIVFVAAILALSGLNFSYQVPNEENEIILLVDVSDSEEQAVNNRDRFVELVLQDSSYDGYKVGVVTFGYNQVYAVPLTYEVEEIYERYENAEYPDTTATNVASALNYARGLFTNKQSAKIVLITDGKETDEDAKLVVRSIAAEGIKVDTALIPSEYKGNDMQVVGVELPEYHMVLGEEYALNVNLQSKTDGKVVVDLYDNDTLIQSVSAEIYKGSQSVSVPLTLENEGLHELKVELKASEALDSLSENSIYYTYHYMETFDRLLVLQREEGESEKFVSMINGDEAFDITVKTITDQNIPKTLSELCQYDQIILNNIANADMPRGFVDLLYTYVYECGGGMFTIGGDKVEGEGSVANAYNRKDLYNTLYQQMLPVEAINYTPPLGVMVLMDTSGSMGSADASVSTKLDWAKAGVEASLSALSTRDYIGVVTFDDFADTVLELTSRTQEARIQEKLNDIKDRDNAGGGTVVLDAIKLAGQALSAQENIAKRHIVIVTDGAIAAMDQVLLEADSLYKKHGITISVVGIAIDATAEKSMNQLIEVSHGRLIVEEAGDDLVAAMREELNVQPLKEVEDITFNPIIKNTLSPLVRGLDRFIMEDGTVDNNKLAVTLDGFYGVKARATADLVLVGDYEVPIYAQWAYGEGMVGSFMCDLQEIRSSAFMKNNENGDLGVGAKFIRNVINNLMPTQNIRPNDIRVELREDNYTNKLSVYLGTPLAEKESLKGTVYNSAGEVVLDLNSVTESNDFTNLSYYVTSCMNGANKYSRADFVIKESGTYKIVILRYDANGNETGSFEMYKSFAYSEEYNTFMTGPEEGITAEDFAKDIAERGSGAMIADLENPYEIFEGFVTELDKNYDPRMILMIVAIVLFLLDIAARKFKFKWPHEIIRAYREKRNNK